MAVVHTEELAFTELAEANEFYRVWEAFMKDRVLPRWVGAAWITSQVELTGKCFKLVVRANRELGQGSTSMIRFLSQGFIAGWEGAKGRKVALLFGQESDSKE